MYLPLGSSFKILPKPYLKATNVKIMNVRGSDVPLVDIPNLVANLAFVPLLKGNFEVQRMKLQDPLINVEILPDGKLNWQSELTPEQRRNVEDAKFALNSVSIQNAIVNYDDQIRDVGFKLENLNGEVSAQSVLGPYRFEGNYIKDNNTPDEIYNKILHLLVNKIRLEYLEEEKEKEIG